MFFLAKTKKGREKPKRVAKPARKGRAKPRPVKAARRGRAKPRPAKAARKRPSPEKKASVSLLDMKTKELAGKIKSTRNSILKNEAALKAKILEKNRAEANLNRLLKASFLREKAKLAMVKSGSARKQTSLRQRISSLERINKIYEEKKGKITNARKKQASLKRQLESLEKNVGVLGKHA